MQKERVITDLQHQRGPSMKIKVRNLGIIHETAEIDLKPLTILIGPNNSGKTWLAYTLAGIFSKYGYIHYTQPEKLGQRAKDYPSLIEAVDQILENGAATINLLDFAKQYGEIYFNNLARDAREWLAEFMGTKLASFEQLELSIDLQEAQTSFLHGVLHSQLQTDMGLRRKGANRERRVLLSFSKESGKELLHLYTFSEELLEKELPRASIEKRVVENVLRIIHQALYPSVTILPTERTNTPSFNNSMTFTSSKDIEQKEFAEEVENALHDFIQFFMQEIKKNGTRLSGPVSSYFNSTLATQQLGAQDKREREKIAKTIPEVEEYIRLARLLEESILGGNVDFLPSESETGQPREIVFRPATSTDPLELSISSSMVKELSPLVFHLRNFAMPGELLIIDEPEMNLHPQAQVQMIEFLAMLVNAGLRILVTTHSPYMIDHLTNLTLAAAKDDKEAICSKFFLHDSRAFIEKDEVSVYLVDGGKVTDILNDEEQNWDTFGEVSNHISDIYFTL